MWEVKVCILLGLFALTTTYEIGSKNKYSYETTVAVDEKCGLQDESKLIGHQLKADVQITNIWENSQQKLIKIEILNSKILVQQKSSLVSHASELDSLQSTPSYLLWEEGSPRKIWEDPSEHFSLRNLKRGISSLLQLRKTSERTKETDVSGECDVIYEIKETSIHRRKGNCVHPKFDKTVSQANGVRSATTQYQSSSNCDWTNGNNPTISKCTISEYVKMFSNIWHKPSLCVDTKSELKFIGSDKDQNIYKGKEIESVIEELKKSGGKELAADDITSILYTKEEKPKKKQLKPSVAKQQASLSTEHLAKLKSVVAFYKLLPTFRDSTKDEILQLLNNRKLESIKNQLLDLVSACATDECIKAAFEFFENEKEYSLPLERFVISLSILPKPSSIILTELMSFTAKFNHHEKIKAQLVATLGFLLKTYAENYEVLDKELEEEIRLFLENGLKKCKVDSESCSLTFLRGLRNAARFRSVPILSEYAMKGGKEALEAVQALRNIPCRLLTSEAHTTLLKVFNEVGKRQDRSTRAIAAEVLLRSNPGRDVLRSLLVALSDQSDSEFSTFLAAKIMQEVSVNEELRSNVKNILPEKEVSYYYSLAQNGKSSLFKKPLLSIEGTNVTYGIDMEMLNGGLLKRSVFDVSFENLAGDSSLLSVGIFAQGLGAVAGDSSGGDDEDSSPTAGMELGILGSALRPYVFFKSTSELMGHAWSGTASEQTPVLQTIVAFSDNEKIAVLSNGMVARGQMRGVLSTDASASVQISLWNRNSQSIVKTQGALLVRGSVTVDAGFVVTQGTIQFKGESGIDFNTDLEFAEMPFSMCLQMKHPDIEIFNDLHRSVSLPGTKYNLRRSKKRKISIPGRSFALHENNNDMCRIMNNQF
ncbi:hypothetical protein JTE90_000356 [Oedothorax gibbosus]|uniref:Vitellogenin domain-containing protein n=1 Tax=Oedothorax gibbosus TaxID=931172 RepID=A0AAV6U3Y8_9ARAC|nr:hypothetical protein JTE90_000356 [Oedothorax gibbosus]